MEFYLTSKLICPIGYNPIPREYFEEWLKEEYLIEGEELAGFWNGDFEYWTPEQLIQTYMRSEEARKKPDVFTRILSALNNISRS